MSRTDRVMQLLGLARRAGGVAAGVEAVRDAVRAGSARLVLLAEDASAAQLDKVRRTSAGSPVRTARLGDRAMLGTAVGLAPLSAVAVTEASLADRLAEELGELLVEESLAVDSVGAER